MPRHIGFPQRMRRFAWQKLLNIVKPHFKAARAAIEDENSHVCALSLEDVERLTTRPITLNSMPFAIQASDVLAAAERIRPLARRTPVFTSAGFDSEAGTRVYFKCENLQRGGAFKI